MRAVVLTVSDRVSGGEAADLSGPAAAAALLELGFEPEVRVIPDGVDSVAAALQTAVDDEVALVVTTGGTGMAPRDLTPEATLLVIEREAPGLSEAMRAATLGELPHGMLSRGVSGIAGSTLILNLPGSPRGVEESLAVVGPALAHAVALIRDESTSH
ncbi:MAG: MogA/MoaB family molybdenum cofactor biosynthesis protein [Acidimicrobiia bacterium]